MAYVGVVVDEYVGLLCERLTTRGLLQGDCYKGIVLICITRDLCNTCLNNTRYLCVFQEHALITPRDALSRFRHQVLGLGEKKLHPRR